MRRRAPFMAAGTTEMGVVPQGTQGLFGGVFPVPVAKEQEIEGGVNKEGELNAHPHHRLIAMRQADTPAAGLQLTPVALQEAILLTEFIGGHQILAVKDEIAIAAEAEGVGQGAEEGFIIEGLAIMIAGADKSRQRAGVEDTQETLEFRLGAGFRQVADNNGYGGVALVDGLDKIAVDGVGSTRMPFVFADMVYRQGGR